MSTMLLSIHVDGCRKEFLQDDIEEEDGRLEQLCLKLYMLQYFKMYFYVNVSRRDDGA
jgi:hypothetical protein